MRSAADEKGKTSVTVVSCESSRLDGARTYDNNLHMNQPAANLNLDEQRWVIRQANIEDHSVIVSYNLALAEETEGKTLARAALQAGVQKGLERPDLCRYFVVERDGQVVAQAMVTFELTDWRGGIFWWLQSVYVHPRHRQVGVFRNFTITSRSARVLKAMSSVFDSTSKMTISPRRTCTAPWECPVHLTS